MLAVPEIMPCELCSSDVLSPMRPGELRVLLKICSEHVNGAAGCLTPAFNGMHLMCE